MKAVVMNGTGGREMPEHVERPVGASLRCETAPKPAYAKRLLHRDLRPDRLAVTL